MTEILSWKDLDAEKKIAAGDVLKKGFGSFETPRLLWQWTLADDAAIFEIRPHWKLDADDIKTTYLSDMDVQALFDGSTLIEWLCEDEIAEHE